MIKNKLHQRRWDAAKVLFVRLKDTAEYFKWDIWFAGEFIKPDQIIITDYEIYVQIGNCRYVQFVANSDHDEGCYETITDYRKRIKERFKLVKIINW